MKKRNFALVVLLVFASAVLTASMVLVVVPQMKHNFALDMSESTQVIQDKVQQQIDEYNVEDLAQNFIVKESLDQTKETVEKVQEIVNLK